MGGIQVVDQASASSEMVSLGVIKVSPISQERTEDSIIEAARMRRTQLVVTPNIVQLWQSRNTTELRDAYVHADICPPDGWPVAALTGAVCGQKVARVTGSDLVITISKKAHSARIPVMYVGGAGRSAERVARKYDMPTRRINRYEPAPPREVATAEGVDALVARIMRSGTNIAFIGLGVPKQEIVANRLVRAGYPGAILCVGSGIEYAAGYKTRAPLAMQKTNTEWLHRLVTEPRKMATRYVLASGYFAYFSLGVALTKKKQVRALERSKVDIAA